MTPGTNRVLAEDFAATLAWWREAGVDSCFQDQPRQWLEPSAPPQTPASLADIAPAAQTAPPSQPAVPALDENRWPRDIAAFRQWWLSEPELDDGRLSGRVAPRTAARAACMIVVEEPEAGDSEHLLGGPQGAILSDMLRALDLAEDSVHVASVLPRHMPLPDWQALAAKGFGRLLAHHVGLVAPQRLIVLGSNIPPLLGHSLPNSAETLPRFNHEGISIPLYAGRGLATLLERPRWKAGLWLGLLDWIARDPTG
jgi:hypothetical protein